VTWWEALILGVIQGLTEFFPVSSSGHLVMTERLLGLELPGLGFEVAVHVATLVSVLAVYRKRITSLTMGLFGRGDEDAWQYLTKLIIASVPAGIVGVMFKDWFEVKFDDPAFAGTMLLVTGCFVWSTRWNGTEGRYRHVELVPIVAAAGVSVLAGTVLPFLIVFGIVASIMATARLTAPAEWVNGPGYGGAAFMGIAQAAAILPGISRSGSTVVTGIWRRIDPLAAAEFSFLMSIPAILGAAVLSLPDLAAEGSTVTAVPLIVGFIGAAVAGVLAIRFFVALLKRQNFYSFAWYCWLAGSFFLLYLHLGS
jgi:undecaprenyl-diphosphatase